MKSYRQLNFPRKEGKNNLEVSTQSNLAQPATKTLYDSSFELSVFSSTFLP